MRRILRLVSACSMLLMLSLTIGVSGCASDGDPVLNTSMMPTKLLGGVPPQDEPDLSDTYGELPDRREAVRESAFDDE